MTSPIIPIHPADDVVIARRGLFCGTAMAVGDVTVVRLVSSGEKGARRAAAQCESVRRCKRDIGRDATLDIFSGLGIEWNWSALRARQAEHCEIR